MNYNLTLNKRTNAQLYSTALLSFLLLPIVCGLRVCSVLWLQSEPCVPDLALIDGVGLYAGKLLGELVETKSDVVALTSTHLEVHDVPAVGVVLSFLSCDLPLVC